jgi:hypothetical protein
MKMIQALQVMASRSPLDTGETGEPGTLVVDLSLT